MFYYITYGIIGNSTVEGIVGNSTVATTSINITNLEIYEFYEVRVSAFTVAEGPSSSVFVRTDSSSKFFANSP